MNTICVCGAGTMGSGIAQTAAQSGFSTILYELNETVLDKARSSIEKIMSSLVEKGRISAEYKTATLQRIQFTNKIEHCIADICIEAIIEKMDAKLTLFNQLEELNTPGCVLASNTSSLSIGAIASQLKNPGRVIGLHFFNPAPLMKLVEVVTTSDTNKEIIKQVVGLAKQMGKTPVICSDSPGFIVNRVARPYYIESLRLAEENITGFQQADTLLEATGFKMGPFKLMDLIGNDINYAVSQSVYEQMNKPDRLKPSPIQQEKVEKGDLGRKTGKGYYQY